MTLCELPGLWAIISLSPTPQGKQCHGIKKMAY